MGPGQEDSINNNPSREKLLSRKRGFPSKSPPRRMEDIHHRSTHLVNRALAHHPEQRIDLQEDTCTSTKSFVSVKNRFEILSLFNDDDSNNYDDYNEYDDNFVQPKGKSIINDFSYNDRFVKGHGDFDFNDVLYEKMNKTMHPNDINNNNNNNDNNSDIEMPNYDGEYDFNFNYDEDVNYVRETKNGMKESQEFI